MFYNDKDERLFVGKARKLRQRDFVLSDIHVKKYNGIMYLKIDDLETVGLIRPDESQADQ